MGVLKVKQPDGSWNVVGCDGSGSTPGRLKLWTGTRWAKERCPAVVADDFDRADGALGSPWTFPGTPWSILSHEAKPPAAANTGDNQFALVDMGTSVTDIQVDLTALSDLSGYTGPNGLVWNWVDASNYYRWEINYNGSAVARVVGGVATNIVPLSGTNNGAGGTGTYRVTHAADGTVTLFWQGVQKAISSSYALDPAGTKLGVYSADTGPAGRFDNFTAQTLPPGHPLKVWDGTAWQIAACLQTLDYTDVYTDGY